MQEQIARALGVPTQNYDATGWGTAMPPREALNAMYDRLRALGLFPPDELTAPANPEAPNGDFA